jgi:hypothetical protein
MAEEEGFEPPRAVTPLSVFKTDPFSRTWVFLRIDEYKYIKEKKICQFFFVKILDYVKVSTIS